jgi:hypothetical protein
MNRLIICSFIFASSMAAATPTGRRWPLAPCAASCPVGQACSGTRCVPQFKIATSVMNSGQATIAGNVPYSAFLTRMPGLFRAWSATQVTGCQTSYDVVPGTNFGSPQGISAILPMDSSNNVMWLKGTSWRHGSTELALTTVTFYTDNNEIFDADIEMNDNVEWSITGEANKFDMDTVLIHETGHFLGLNHTPDSIAVMYANVNLGQQKRQLTTLDTDDVCTVYPAVAGGQGEVCLAAAMCTGGRVCEGRVGSVTKFCTKDCTAADMTCPSGFSCQPSNAMLACLPVVGAVDQCKFCANAGSCSSGICLRDSSNGVNYCSSTCSDNSQCASGNSCQSTPSGKFCLPITICNQQCTSPANCAADYNCTNGTCLPKGTIGSRCEVSEFCSSCGACTIDNNNTAVAFCRSCCGGSGGNGLCNACAGTACAANFSCTGLTNGVDSVCLPGPAAGARVCESCGATMACGNGLVCTAGKCRAACNPQSPGTCNACADLTGGNGVCACAGEVSRAGEPCGINGGQLAACGLGLFCVGDGTNGICRSSCTVQNPASCPLGESCTLAAGIGICLPGMSGGRCSMSNNAGACNGTLTSFQGRCYDSCNVNLSSTCPTCVQTQAGGLGVCGCPDEIAKLNEACGTQPMVRACTTGTLCLEGYCRGQCNPTSATNCPANTECRAAGNGGSYCQDIPTSSAGGGGAAGGSSSATGGGTRPTGGGAAGGGSSQDLGCSCGEVGLIQLIGALAYLGKRFRRRESGARS